MASIWFGVIFLALVRNSASVYDESVCEILEKSCGLIPPALPTNFELKGEHVDHDANSAVYEEMYFDHVNSRAKYKFLLNTIEYHFLFDYDSQQIVKWYKVHPGTSMMTDPLYFKCEAVDMDESDMTYIFGDKDKMDDRPKMFNANEVLRYGGQYLYAANGTTKLWDRNIPANKFVGCVYDKSIDATLRNDYYFADTSAMEPSGGTPSSIVTGSRRKPLSVPVRMHITGLRNDTGESIPLNKTYSISWFKGEPKFHMDTFQIPPWIHCTNYRNRKQKPKFPTAFSTRVVVTKFSVDILGHLQTGNSYESYEEIYYDSDKRLARRDFTPVPKEDTDIYSKFGSYTPVSAIYDFNEGLRYTINKASGRCYFLPIPENDFFDTEQDLIVRKLATPEEMFFMQMDDMEYKGETVVRDIKCDVWNGQHEHKKYNATVVKETYFSTDGWHELAEEMSEYSVPVRHVIIPKTLDDNLSRRIEARDFLKFKAKAPNMVSFNIQNCMEDIKHKRFAIELALNPESSEQIFKYKFLFLEAAQLHITNTTQIITPIRVQRLHLRHLSASSDRVFLVFSLLEKANLKDLSVLVGQKGKNLQEAINLLQEEIDDGKFIIELNNPSNRKETITVFAERGSLYSLTANGSLSAQPLKPAKWRHPETDKSVIGEKETVYDEVDGMKWRESEKADEETTDEEHNGMKSGYLALLAIAMLCIGIGIGMAIMHVYIKNYSERQVDDKTILTPGPSSEEAYEERSV